jgi:putative component of membrane protein insertase Oxa1/YidC/SpoIIIJ protein YidD
VVLFVTQHSSVQPALLTQMTEIARKSAAPSWTVTMVKVMRCRKADQSGKAAAPRQQSLDHLSESHSEDLQIRLLC